MKQLVEALLYKSVGRGFDSRWCHWKFHWHNPSGRKISLGLSHPLTKMCTRNISCGVKAAGAYGWQIYHLHVPIVLKSGSLKLLEPSGPVQACNGIALPFCLYLCSSLTTWDKRISFHLPKKFTWVKITVHGDGRWSVWNLVESLQKLILRIQR